MAFVEFDWRPLILLFIAALVMLLWLFGCAIANDSSRSSVPTSYPQVTLTVGRLTFAANPTSSPVPPQLMERTRAAYASPPPAATSSGDSIGSTNARPLFITSNIPSLHIPPPTCYETATGSILCLGRVDNPLTVAVSRVVVEVRLFIAGGSSFVQRVLVDQAVIPPGESAPYRVIIPIEWNRYVGSSSRLVRAEAAAIPDVTPAVEQQNLIRASEDRYTLTALVHAPEDHAIRLDRAVIMLTEGERVRAYRVVTFDDALLTPGETFSLRVDVTAQEHSGDLQSSLHLETRP